MFCLLQIGVKEVQTAEGKELITDRDILLLSSGSTLMSERVAENKEYEAILIFFSNKVLSDYAATSLCSKTNLDQAKGICKFEKDPFINNFCESLQLLRRQGNSEMDELKARELLMYVSVRYPDQFKAFVLQAFNDKTEIKLRQVVSLNLNKGLSIDELAFLCDMSVSTFKRHFMSTYKMSPQRYFQQMKMDKARFLLSLQKRPSEIYTELGYANLAAFSNEFKKYFGCSPSQFPV